MTRDTKIAKRLNMVLSIKKRVALGKKLAFLKSKASNSRKVRISRTLSSCSKTRKMFNSSWSIARLKIKEIQRIFRVIQMTRCA